MNDEEMNEEELRRSVKDVLIKDGAMRKMRAQMRDCVLRVLKQKTPGDQKPLYSTTERSRELKDVERVTRAYAITRGFLQHHDLCYSDSVLKGEAGVEDDNSITTNTPELPAKAASRLKGEESMLVEIVEDWLHLIDRLDSVNSTLGAPAEAPAAPANAAAGNAQRHAAEPSDSEEGDDAAAEGSSECSQQSGQQGGQPQDNKQRSPPHSHSSPSTTASTVSDDRALPTPASEPPQSDTPSPKGNTEELDLPPPPPVEEVEEDGSSLDMPDVSDISQSHNHDKRAVVAGAAGAADVPAVPSVAADVVVTADEPEMDEALTVGMAPATLQQTQSTSEEDYGSDDFQDQTASSTSSQEREMEERAAAALEEKMRLDEEERLEREREEAEAAERAAAQRADEERAAKAEEEAAKAAAQAALIQVDPGEGDVVQQDDGEDDPFEEYSSDDSDAF
eukprot:Rhum_TRINITY_DN15201_c5_g2::Rhum_TRINITY_DN15201_c5_g2_i1::g.144158::m.144158